MLNLASDPKEHFNIGLHITQTNNKYWLANSLSHLLHMEDSGRKRPQLLTTY